MELVKAKLARIDGEESDAVAMILDSRLDALMWEHRDLILRCVDTVAGIEKLIESAGPQAVVAITGDGVKYGILHKDGMCTQGTDLHSAVRAAVAVEACEKGAK